MTKQPKQPISVELGNSGLQRSGGRVHDEFHRRLRGLRGVRVYREMKDNNAVIGGSLLAIESLVKRASWKWETASQSPGPLELAARDFAESAWLDTSHSWTQFLSEVLSMLPYGWAFFEIVYKRRVGGQSRWNDGRIGWKKWGLRVQESLQRWEFDDEGGIDGMWQRGTYGIGIGRGAGPVFIPIQKAALFRVGSHRGNPEGRALDPETPIPTPDGWRTMDALQPGDKVFDEAGQIRYVRARQEWEDRPCYRVKFSTGDEIIADANHQWFTIDKRARDNRLAGAVRTTAEIAETVKCKGVSNHAIRWAAAIDYPEQQLLLDPWYLGLWLGDGNSANAAIACHVQDAEETQQLITACGYQAIVVHNGREGGNGRQIRVYGEQKWDRQGPASLLTAMGLRENKHVPAAYMRGSIEQRRALLSGLMDSDGHIDDNGRCEFVNCNRGLVDSVTELVRSLGVGCTNGLRARANGIDRLQDSYAARFTPTWSPFRLSRKANKAKLARARSYHYITECERVASRRTVCIEVDSPSHLFLAGRCMVPTHNSLLRNAYRSWYFLKKLQEIEGIAMERELAGLPVARVPPEFLLASATDEQKAMVADLKLLVQKVRTDERAGLVIPASKVDGMETGYDFGLISSGGGRAVDISGAIVRYEQRIALTMLSQFLLLGMNKVGSFALSKGHESVFGAGVGAVMDEISDVVNRFVVPPLMRLNGFPPEVYPRLVHGEVDAPELGQLANYVSSLISSGALHPDAATEARLREFASLEARQRATDKPGTAAPTVLPDTGAPEIESGEVPQAAEPGAAGAATTEAAETAVVSDVALNGAQVTAALEIADRVAFGRLPRASGVASLVSMFGLSPEAAEAIIGPAGTAAFVPTPEPE